MILIPNDRLVIRLAPGFRLQTGYEAEKLCVKRIRALKWLRYQRGKYQRPRPRLRAVS